jgi:TrmH family RNA methyltransferase
VIRDVEGRHNHSVKLARKLQKKKHRRERGLLVGEGLDLLVLAVAHGVEMGDVLVRRDVLRELPPALLELAEAGGVDIGVCTEETMSEASSLGGAADVIFVARQPAWSLADLDLEHGLCLYLEGLGDPGNVGTLVRGCVGFGAGGMAVSPGTADPYGPKAMRAGMGAQFLLPIVVEVTPADLTARLRSVAAAGGRPPAVLVADPHEGQDGRQVHREQGLVPVLGSDR